MIRGFTPLALNCGAVSTWARKPTVGPSRVPGIVASTAPYSVSVTSSAPIAVSSATSRRCMSSWMAVEGELGLSASDWLSMAQ